MSLLPQFGVAAQSLQLPAGFPLPGDAEVSAALELLRAAPRDALLLIDGLAFGALPARRLAQLQRPLVALVHHPLACEAGLTEAQRQALLTSERAALAQARHVIVTSATTQATLVADFGVAKTAISVAEPGVDRAGRAITGHVPPILLGVGAITPRKAFDVLIAALAPLAHLPWQLQIAGSLDRAPHSAIALRAQIAAAGLEARVDLLGEINDARIAAAYAGADVFVSSSLYEGYGMAFAEAMARGLPIVCACGGASGQTVPDAAALKVAPGDVRGLSAALERALGDAGLRRRLAHASWLAGQTLPQWADTAALVAQALQRVARTGATT